MFRLALISLSLLSALGGAHAAFAGTIDDGRQLFRTATRADGTAVRALVQSDVALPASAAACSNCHRRSGIGVSEGGSRSLNLTASALFEPTNKPPLRPAYDESTLTRAIVAGIAADGRTLDATMPRYDLSADDAAALAAYLRTLGATAPAGVTDTDLHIATIISADAPAHERAAVKAVMQSFVDIKNGGTRHEAERAAASERHYYGRNRQRAHRTWQLHVWSLDGPESSWPEQLDALYAATTPFAIVSGTAGSAWSVVDRFCEQYEVPCILPLSNFSPIEKPGFYSLYFSTGAALDATITAKSILQSDLPKHAKIVVVYDDTVAGRTAVDTIRSQLAAGGYSNLRSHPMRPGKPPTVRGWQSMLKAEKADVLISWISAHTLSALVAGSAAATQWPAQIYTGQSFSDWTSISALQELLRDRVHHVYPYSLPRPGLAQFPREYVWLKQKGLTDLDAAAAAKVLFACRVLGMSLADIQNNFSREYLLEMLEHALDGAQLTSVYPRTSLGPDQRYLTHGAYVVRLSGVSGNDFVDPVWTQP